MLMGFSHPDEEPGKAQGGGGPGWNLEDKEGCTGLKAEEAAYAKV